MNMTRRGLFGLPLALPGAVIGVAATTMTATVTNNSDVASFRFKSQRNERGDLHIDVIIDDVERRIAERMARGRGSLGKAMQGRFGVTPAGRG